MKNIIKYIILSLVVIGFSSCEQDEFKVDYDRSLPPAVSFFQPAFIKELAPESDIKILIARTDASQAAKYQVKLTSTSPATLTLFSLPSSEVNFAAGEYELSVDINFVLNSLSAAGLQYKFDIEFDGSPEISKGGNAKTAVTVSRKLTWERKAGYYASAAFGGTFNASIDRAIESPSMFRLANVFDNTILFSIDKVAGTAVIPSQDLGEDIFGAGSNSWISCSKGTYANGVVTFSGGVWDNAFFTSSAMSSGLRMTSEQIILPDEFK